MAEPRFASAPEPGPKGAGAGGCPCVADLIQYALGQISGAERQRIDAHQASCGWCRGWLAKANRYRAEGLPGPFNPVLSPPAGAVLRSAFLPAAAEAAPAPAITTVAAVSTIVASVISIAVLLGK